MFLSLSTAGNPFQQINRRVINRTGDSLAVGEVVQFMLNLDVDGSTTPEALGGGPGTPTGTGTFGTDTTAPFSPVDAIFANVDDVAAVSENVIHVYGVVTDLLSGAGADNTECVVCLQGICTVNSASANYDIGDPLMVTSGANTVSALVAATGQRPIGFSLTEGDTQTSIKCLFFGWAGLFGGQHE